MDFLWKFEAVFSSYSSRKASQMEGIFYCPASYDGQEGFWTFCIGETLDVMLLTEEKIWKGKEE
jgi:GH24 family phage-related lysozyme (muramidase)